MNEQYNVTCCEANEFRKLAPYLTTAKVSEGVLPDNEFQTMAQFNEQ
jgi:hypothetical protein